MSRTVVVAKVQVCLYKLGFGPLGYIKFTKKKSFTAGDQSVINLFFSCPLCCEDISNGRVIVLYFLNVV